MLCDISIICLILSFLLETSKGSSIPGDISVAIIADEIVKDGSRHKTLGTAHAIDFIQRVFTETSPNLIKDRNMWPSIFIKNCPSVKNEASTSYNTVHEAGYSRGLMFAHRQIWDEFCAMNRLILSNISFYESPKIIIFEDDAMEIDSMAHDIAYQSVQNMTSEIHYLGHCYDKKPGVSPPSCLHAYALTVEGARKLLKHCDWCAKGGRSGILDTQIQSIAERKLISWSAVRGMNPYGISSNQIRERSNSEGFTIQWGHEAGGLFYQITYDNILCLKEGFAYMSKWPNKSVFLYLNGTSHRFPNAETFASMGFDFSNVTVVPHWQLMRIIGDPIRDPITNSFETTDPLSIY
jgi:hypothetical protein